MDRDCNVFSKDMLDEEHAKLLGDDKPWLVEFEDGGIETYASEDEACERQREYRIQHGLDEMTGEPI